MSSSAAEEQCRRVAAAVRAPPPPSARRRPPVRCCSRLRRRRPPPQSRRARGQKPVIYDEPVCRAYTICLLRGTIGRRSSWRPYVAGSSPGGRVVAERRGSRACAPATRRDEKEKEKRTSTFLLPRPRRDLPFVLAPMPRRLSPRETAPPRRRRRDQPRSSSERCRAATDMTVGDGIG